MARKAKNSANPLRASGGEPSPIAGAGIPKKTPLTDAERHKRFVDMAREVEASEDLKGFDEAFKIVASTSAKV